MPEFNLHHGARQPRRIINRTSDPGTLTRRTRKGELYGVCTADHHCMELRLEARISHCYSKLAEDRISRAWRSPTSITPSRYGTRSFHSTRQPRTGRGSRRALGPATTEIQSNSLTCSSPMVSIDQHHAGRVHQMLLARRPSSLGTRRRRSTSITPFDLRSSIPSRIRLCSSWPEVCSERTFYWAILSQRCATIPPPCFSPPSSASGSFIDRRWRSMVRTARTVASPAVRR